jgi:hypothetical protein
VFCQRHTKRFFKVHQVEGMEAFYLVTARVHFFFLWFYQIRRVMMFCRNDLVALGLGSPHWVYKLACHFLQMNLFSCVNCCSEQNLHSKNSSKLLNVASDLGSKVQNLETKTSHTRK